jgi:hypothetical protein
VPRRRARVQVFDHSLYSGTGRAVWPGQWDNKI